MLDVVIVIGTGNSSEISTSKIMKVTAIRKNRDETSIRAEFLWSNPHSVIILFSFDRIESLGSAATVQVTMWNYDILIMHSNVAVKRVEVLLYTRKVPLSNIVPKPGYSDRFSFHSVSPASQMSVQ